MGKIGVRELAKELGITDRELIDRAKTVGINIASSFAAVEEAQARVLRARFGKATATTTPTKQADKAAEVVRPSGATVVRRVRPKSEEADAYAEPAVAEPRAVAVVEPVAVAPAVIAPVPNSPFKYEPRIKKIKASELETPPELQLRIYETPRAAVVEEVAPAVAPVAEVAPVEAVVVVEAVAEAAPAIVEAPVVEVAVAAPAKVATVKAPDVVEVAPAATAPIAVAPAAPAVVADPIRTAPAQMGLQDIGKAIESSGAAPSNSRRPTLTRMKMPEVLVNIPKPVMRPAPVVAPVVAEVRPAPSATTGGFGGPRPEGSEAPAPVDDSRGGRGRKLIYDRRRDAQTMSSTDSRVRGKKKGGKMGKGMPLLAPPTKAEKRNIRVEDTISVTNLAAAMSVKSTEVIKTLFGLGMMATVNQPLDVDTVELVAAEFGYTVERVGFDLDAYLQKPEDAPGGDVPRSPVVTVMGHVDHGKTSLLDAIRKTHTAAKEAGGITQHIGAYVAEVPGDHFEDGKDRRVVFLDTPGHEAFSAMRARGAKATDVIVLVVAADDGVMPQTVEAINHGKAAKVPMIVAVNKIDKPGADLDRVKRELADNGLVAEDWGGDTIFVDVSAKTGQNLDKLLDMLAVQADVLELTANPDQDARGLVIESRLEKGRGPVATLLVQHGTLKRGQFIVAGSQYCKVRAMLSDLGKPLELAGPSTPAEVIGFDHVTSAGDEFYVVADEKKARAIVEHRIEKQREKDALKTSKRSLEDMFAQTTETAQKELNLIVKADVHGSAEALKESLSKIEHEEVKVRVLHAAVGGVTESDINLAATAKGLIIAFNVKPEAKGKRLADDLGVQIRQYSVIYDAIDDVTLQLEGMLTPIIEEVILGHAEIRQIFSVPKLGVIAGSNVTDGLLQRSQQLRVLRGKEVLFEGEFGSLRRFKDDVREVTIGYDCGVGITNFTKFQVGDVIECYELKKIARKLKPEATHT